MPWEAKGWTQQQWFNWHQQRQPESLSSCATLNASWFVGNGMKFRSGGQSYRRSATFKSIPSCLLGNLPSHHKLHLILVCMAWSD